MTKYFLLICLIVFPFTGTGCRGISLPNKRTEVHTVLSFIKENGTLKVKEDGKVCPLANDGMAYEVFVSPDARYIAVETLLMSDLQIIRIYKKDIDGCFSPLKHAASTSLWHRLSATKGFSIDRVNHPRMKFLKWIDNKHVLIEMTGDIDGKSIDEKVMYVPE